MATTTVPVSVDGLFNSVGAYCPVSSMPFVKIGRIFDFAKQPVAASAQCNALVIPKGFVLLGVLVEELQKLDTAAASTITIKDSTGAIATASNCGDVTGHPDLAYNYGTPTSSTGGPLYKDGELLTLTPSADVAGGVVRVYAIGFSVHDNSVDDGPDGMPAYTKTAQTKFNVSGGDPMYNYPGVEVAAETKTVESDAQA